MSTRTASDVPMPERTHCLDGWQENVDGMPEYRVISGADRHIRSISGIVGTSAVQYVDGTIDRSPEDSPRVWADFGAANMTSAQAREFAAAIVAAADEIDGW
ncbi:hypothetical protein KXD97_00260 [Mycobacterium sp. SMC-8]|uniref:hypothetical protein n=1 Tax=Mycobacterium sp. SMC-8 TaxID=2857060 RepID=UPI0021B174AC|nr:hypothetical protein [Mycobacterium sp. SMC-8]UXA12391.1 hypothetical protein KXD97_00260 [Mycobacterium sp. SMC-8]